MKLLIRTTMRETEEELTPLQYDSVGVRESLLDSTALHAVDADMRKD